VLALSPLSGWGFSLEEGPFPEMVMLALAVLLDLIFGEIYPARLHPVVWMGRVIQFLATPLTPTLRNLPNPPLLKRGFGRGSEGVSSGRWSRANFTEFMFGVALALLVPGCFAAAAYFALEGLRTLSEIGYILVGALVLKSTFAVSMLDKAASQVCRRLEEGHLDEARADLRSLVSRDTFNLPPELATAAAVESVAENTTDSFLAPWLAFALFGVPGAVAYRAINTLDSMIGYHGIYEYLGKASARLDDLVNLVPARLSAMLIVAGGIFGHGGAREAKNSWRVMWRDHARTPSPNAGWTMSSMAGALGVQLEKAGHYRLGDSQRALVPQAIKRAIGRMYFVAFSGLLIALAIVLVRHAII